MIMSEQTIPIPGRLKNVAIGGHVAGSEDIDAGGGKTQKQVNDKTNDTLALHQSEISGLNSQNYVSVSTYSSLPAMGSVDTIYRVSSWDGNANSGLGAADVTKYTEYAWNGTTYIVVSVKTQIGEVFDISEYKAIGGTLATFENLSAALDNGNNVPVGVRKGGMSVKYVQSSDNKYVQARLMSDEFTTDVTQWQGVDEEPTSGSDNLVKSAGVYQHEKNIVTNGIIEVNYLLEYYNPQGALVDGGIGWGHTPHIPIESVVFPITLAGGGNLVGSIAYFDKDDNFISAQLNENDTTYQQLDNIPENAVYVSFSNYYNGSIITQQVSINPTTFYGELKTFLPKEKFQAIYTPNTLNVGYLPLAYGKVGNLVDFGGTWKHTPHIPIEQVILPITIEGNSLVGSISYFDNNDVFCGMEAFADGNKEITAFHCPANTRYVSISNNTLNQHFSDISIRATSKRRIWEGKKIGFLGDSITYNGEYVAEVAAVTGCTPINYGVGGSSIAHINASGWPDPFIDRYSDMANDLDCLVIFGGVNDHQLGVPMGEFKKYNSDGSLDDTFYGAMHTLLRGVINKYPFIPILFVTPMHYTIDIEGWSAHEYTINANDELVAEVRWTPGGPAGQESGGTLKDYVNAIREVCQFYSIPVCDLYSDSTIQPMLTVDKTNKTQDGTHPNDFGGQIIGDIIADKLNSLIY